MNYDDFKPIPDRNVTPFGVRIVPMNSFLGIVDVSCRSSLVRVIDRSSTRVPSRKYLSYDEVRRFASLPFIARPHSEQCFPLITIIVPDTTPSKPARCAICSRITCRLLVISQVKMTFYNRRNNDTSRFPRFPTFRYRDRCIDFDTSCRCRFLLRRATVWMTFLRREKTRNKKGTMLIGIFSQRSLNLNCAVSVTGILYLFVDEKF